jgi:multidrug resistance efflux pump
MRKIFGLFAAALLALCAAGCSGGQAAQPQPSATTETKSYVTAFGTVQCTKSLVLALPVETRLLEVYTREGQTLPVGTPVFKIDMEALKRDKTLLVMQFECESAAWETVNTQVKQAEAELAIAQAAEKAMHTDELLGILKKLANAGSRAKRGAYEAQLLAYLIKTDSVGQYQDLMRLTTDRRNVASNARPALLQLKEQLLQNRKELESRLLTLQQTARQAQADTLSLKQKTDIINNIFSGQVLCGIGRFREDGVFITADQPLLLATAPQYANQTLSSGSASSVFEAPDTREIQANIEEQLIPGVSVGAEVQISPQYDKGTVWIGTVKAISDRAIAVNGETVVPVAITSKDLPLGPGYNVIVKIYPLS